MAQREGDLVSKIQQPPVATLPHSEDTDPTPTLHPHVKTEPTLQVHNDEPTESPSSAETNEIIPNTTPNEDLTTTTHRRSMRQRNPVNYRTLNDPFL